MQIILTLTVFPPVSQSPSSHSPVTVSARPSAIRRNSIGRHKNTSSMPSSASKTPSCFLAHTLHLRMAVPPPSFHPMRKAAAYTKKRSGLFVRSTFFGNIRRNYFIAFGKVFTSASETHWVTAASYAASCADLSISS